MTFLGKLFRRKPDTIPEALAENIWARRNSKHNHLIGDKIDLADGGAMVVLGEGVVFNGRGAHPVEVLMVKRLRTGERETWE